MPLLVVTAALLASMPFGEAKLRADADEASLTPAQNRALVESQGAFIGPTFEDCMRKTGLRVLPDFVVVAQLDGVGRVARTWLEGGGAFGACVQEHLGGAHLFTPPRGTFFTSFVFNFTTQA